MKSRETFDIIRKQPNQRFGLKARLILLVPAGIITSISLSLAVSTLLNKYFFVESKILLLLELIVFGLITGTVVTIFFSKWFFKPIKELQKAIEKVADGDFTVRLKTKSSSQEIQEVYSGFNLMAHELQATEILQTDFVSNVSHEFKTPINAIEGYATLLQGCDNFDEEQKQYVDKILFNTKRLSNLVGNILLLSKLDNQTIQTNQTKFRLDEQIRQSIVMMEPAWEEKEIELDVEMESIEYIGNEPMMHHVWDNLIGNAIKFNPRNGMVRIRLTKQNEKIVFTVEDSGPGIPAEAQKHIFDKFYQADSSHKQDGNGLGLPLVKSILKIYGGEIYVENIAGGGCRFKVILNS